MVYAVMRHLGLSISPPEGVSEVIIKGSSKCFRDDAVELTSRVEPNRNLFPVSLSPPDSMPNPSFPPIGPPFIVLMQSVRLVLKQTCSTPSIVD